MNGTKKSKVILRWIEVISGILGIVSLVVPFFDAFWYNVAKYPQWIFIGSFICPSLGMFMLLRWLWGRPWRWIGRLKEFLSARALVRRSPGSKASFFAQILGACAASMLVGVIVSKGVFDGPFIFQSKFGLGEVGALICYQDAPHLLDVFGGTPEDFFGRLVREAARDGGLGNIATKRIWRQPANQKEARQLGRRYNAILVIWGSLTGGVPSLVES